MRWTGTSEMEGDKRRDRDTTWTSKRQKTHEKYKEEVQYIHSANYNKNTRNAKCERGIKQWAVAMYTEKKQQQQQRRRRSVSYEVNAMMMYFNATHTRTTIHRLNHSTTIYVPWTACVKRKRAQKKNTLTMHDIQSLVRTFIRSCFFSSEVLFIIWFVFFLYVAPLLS